MRAATSVVSDIASEAVVRKTEDPFDDLKARLLDDKDIAKKTEYLMRGNTDSVLSAYDKMVAKTQTRMAEYVHKLSADLAAERDPKMRAKLEDDISSVLAAVKATRSKFKAERMRLKAAVRAMRTNPKMKKQATSILSTGVKIAITVFGVAAVSYAGYHYGSKLWNGTKSEGATNKPWEVAATPGSENLSKTLTGVESAVLSGPDHMATRKEMMSDAKQKADLAMKEAQQKAAVADKAYARLALHNDADAVRAKYLATPTGLFDQWEWWTNPKLSQKDKDWRALNPWIPILWSSRT